MTTTSIENLTYANLEDVLDKDLTTPPGGESSGDRYLVDSPATGAWSGKENNIAEWNGSSYDFTVPNGRSSLVADEDEVYRFENDSWSGTGFTGSQIQEYGNFNLQRATTVAGLITVSDSGLGLIASTVSDPVNPPDVLDQGLNTPPGSPSTGDLYIIGTSPTGAWAGQANNLALYNGSTWGFSQPVDKESYYSVSDNSVFIFRGLTGVWEDTGFCENLGPVLALTATPPGSPSANDRYAVAGSATGAWSGQDNKVAVYNGATWDYYTPFEGMRLLNLNNNQLIDYTSSAFVQSSESIDDLGITLYSPPA